MTFTPPTSPTPSMMPHLCGGTSAPATALECSRNARVAASVSSWSGHRIQRQICARFRFTVSSKLAASAASKGRRVTWALRLILSPSTSAAYQGGPSEGHCENPAKKTPTTRVAVATWGSAGSETPPGGTSSKPRPAPTRAKRWKWRRSHSPPESWQARNRASKSRRPFHRVPGGRGSKRSASSFLQLPPIEGAPVTPSVPGVTPPPAS